MCVATEEQLWPRIYDAGMEGDGNRFDLEMGCVASEEQRLVCNGSHLHVVVVVFRVLGPFCLDAGIEGDGNRFDLGMGCVASEEQRLVKVVREHLRLERFGLNFGYQDPSIWCDQVRLIE